MASTGRARSDRSRLDLRRPLGAAAFHQSAENIAGRVAGVLELWLGGTTGLLGLFLLGFLGGVKGVGFVQEFLGHLVDRARLAFAEVVSSSSSSSCQTARRFLSASSSGCRSYSSSVADGGGGALRLGSREPASLKALIVMVSPP